MKKIVILIMSLILIFSLTGCSDNWSDSDNDGVDDSTKLSKSMWEQKYKKAVPSIYTTSSTENISSIQNPLNEEVEKEEPMEISNEESTKQSEQNEIHDEDLKTTDIIFFLVVVRTAMKLLTSTLGILFRVISLFFKRKKTDEEKNKLKKEIKEKFLSIAKAIIFFIIIGNILI